MENEEQTRSWGHWKGLLLAFILIAGLATVLVKPRDSSEVVSIRIDSNGTTRIGPLPLHNTNLRDAAFSAVGHLNKGTVPLSVAKSARFSDVAKTVAAMRQSGITSFTLRVEQSLPTNGSPTYSR